MARTGRQGDGQHDRFYEINEGGRTIFVRVGPSGPGKRVKGWDPGQGASIKPNAGEIKAIYDEDGNALDNKTAYWWLMQDHLRDEHPDAEALSSFAATGKTDALAYKTIRKMQLHEKIVQLTKAAAKRGAKPGDLRRAPVEISGQDFRLRSGEFSYDAWDAAGHAELEDLRHESDPARREVLLATLKKKQPYQRRRPVVDADGARPARDARGRMRKSEIVYSVDKAGEQPVPQFAAIRYVNDNPDGTATVIDCSQDGSTKGKGRYYIDSPMWRAPCAPVPFSCPREAAHVDLGRSRHGRPQRARPPLPH